MNFNNIVFINIIIDIIYIIVNIIIVIFNKNDNN